MSKAKKLFTLVCALFMGVATFLAWGSMAYAADEPSKIFNIAFSMGIGDIDPHRTSTMPSTNARRMIFEELIFDDRAGNFSPQLAERWEPNEIGDRWRFFLRKGVNFHNGEPFNAKDVKCTMDRLIENKSKLRSAMTFAKTLISCEIIDDYTLDLIFDSPNPYCLKNMAEISIIPDEAYGEYGDDLWNKGLMYGTGPWIFKEWVEGQYIHVVKNPNYWNKAKYDPYYEEAYLRIILEPATAVAAHLAGDIQVNAPQGGSPSEFIPMYETAKNRIQKILVKTPQVYYLTLQCEEGEVFHDKNARMALEFALDRETICKNVLDGDANTVTSIIAPSVFGFDPALPPYEYNPEKAKEFLKKSNYDGRKFTVMSYNGLKKSEDILLTIVDNLRAVGFNAEIELHEYPVFAERRATAQYDIFYQLTLSPSNDPSETLAMRIALPGEGHHFDNKEMQDLIAQVMREMDTSKRASYISRISHLIREEAAPVSAIGSINMTFFCDWGVKGVEFCEDGTVRALYIDYDPALVPSR